MYSLGYHLKDAIELYGKSIGQYSSFFTILVAMIILAIVFVSNLSNRNNTMLTIIIEIICIFLTLYHFGFEIVNHLDSCLNSDFLNNICLYFVNTNIILIVLGSVFSGLYLDYKSRFILLIFYVIILGNLLFSLFISYVIDETLFITLGNIAPMILIGNILAIAAYLTLFIVVCTNKLCKYYVDKKHLLYR